MDNNSYFDNLLGTIFDSYLSNRLKDINLFNTQDNDLNLDEKYDKFISNLKAEKIPYIQKEIKKKKRGMFDFLFNKKGGSNTDIENPIQENEVKTTSIHFQNLITNLEKIVIEAKPGISSESIKNEIYFSSGSHKEALNSLNKSKEWISILDALSQIRLRCFIINMETEKIEDPLFMDNYSFDTYNLSFFEKNDKNKDGFETYYIIDK